MANIQQLSLRDRTFQVRSARIARRADTWQLEVEMESKEYDGELWEPCLSHPGLRLGAHTLEELPGILTSWHAQNDPAYPHPERATMYVFGHHDVRESTLRFGERTGRRIWLEWEGRCDVFWDAEFGENVPFRCQCFAVAGGT